VSGRVFSTLLHVYPRRGRDRVGDAMRDARQAETRLTLHR
jgi:hypothetical protein